MERERPVGAGRVRTAAARQPGLGPAAWAWWPRPWSRRSWTPAWLTSAAASSSCGTPRPGSTPWSSSTTSSSRCRPAGRGWPPTSTVEEVARLARAMTWKFAACRLPYAGAKAGVRWSGTAIGLPSSRRTAMRSSRSRRTFLTGPDLGTDPLDYLEAPEGRAAALGASARGSRAWTTSRPVTASRPPPKPRSDASAARSTGATVAIEGFGKVGCRHGAGVRPGRRHGGRGEHGRGLVADPGGLDVEALLGLRAEHGDALRGARTRLRFGRARSSSSFDLRRPRPGCAARLGDIARSRSGWRCAVVSPGANAPYGAGAPEALHGARHRGAT